MFGMSTRRLLLLSFVANVILLITTLHGSYDLTTISQTELEAWAQLTQAKVGDAVQRAQSESAAAHAEYMDDLAEAEAQAQRTYVEPEVIVKTKVKVVHAPNCTMCEAAPEVCKELGKERMATALSYAGSNTRLRRVLKKMRSGEPWVMGVVGGSVSRGHGIAYGNTDSPYPYSNYYRLPNMHRFIFDHLDARFPSKDPQVAKSLAWAAEDKAKHPKWADSMTLTDIATFERQLNFDTAEIKRPISRAMGFSGKKLGVNSFINGAQGATGSDYFAYCFAEHLPDDVDIVFVELGINDERQLRTFDSYELLIRGLLDLPSKPAIVYVEIFQLMFATMSYGAEIHRGINEYYDIPSVSLRNPYLPIALANSTKVPEMFLPDEAYHDRHEGIDLRHLSNEYHNRTAQLVNAFIDTQICEMDKEGDVDYQEEPIPRQRMSSMYDLDTVMPRIQPQCFSTTSLKHKLVPSLNQGWEEWAWKDKKYIISKTPGSTVEFLISTAFGTVQIIYQRSFKYGLGRARCGLIGVRATDTMLDGYWEMPYNILQTHTFNNVPPGEYTLRCTIQPQTSSPDGGTEFRIASITSM